MQKKSLCIAFILMFVGCSHPPAANKWQYDAASSVKSYEKHFLQMHLLRAKSDLARARSHASQSADLHTRIDIELSVCALHLSILNTSSCENASVLLQIEPNDAQFAYLHLLRSEIRPEEVGFLPAQYKAFAAAMAEKDWHTINARIKQIRPLNSRLIASALVQEHLTEENLQTLITALSYHGYKHPLLAWLNIQMQKEADPQKRAKLKAKIAVLTSG